jgi:diguanylate cyclase (GGDEF)-like protein
MALGKLIKAFSFWLKGKSTEVTIPETANRLVKFKTYEEFQEERVFFAYRPLMYIGIFLDLVFIYGDYVPLGMSEAFYWHALGRVGAATFTAIIVLITFKDYFKKHRGLWILLAGNTSLVCLLIPYIFYGPQFYYVTYNWVFYMLSTIILSPILTNRTFLSVHFGAVIIVHTLLTMSGKSPDQIGEFLLFMVPVSFYLWSVIASYRKEAQASYKSAYQNHIYMTLDTLSQLLNRREFYLQAISKWNEIMDKKSHIAFIMLDIDHFKKVNDTYGHDCGDIVIKSVSNAILKQTRDDDIVGRLGGEEFGVVLPYTTINEAVEVGERIRSHIEDIRTEYEGHLLQVTISVGVAEANTTVNDLSALVSLGDKRLYAAKNGGRNKVVSGRDDQI